MANLLTPQSVDEICNHFGFRHYPRSIGNPRQQFIYTSEEAFVNFNTWNGSSSCFISTNGYDSLFYDGGGKQIPQTIIHETTFFDFDHESKPENAFADAQRLSTFLREMDIAHWVQYSGSKGYHLFIIHEPTRFKFSHRDGSSEALKQILSQTQNHLKQTLGLNTLDAQTTGDPKRLCRFPYSKHANRLNVISNRHAIPVELEWLDTMNHDDIEKMAYRPKYILPKIEGRRLTLRDFIQELGVNLHSPETELRPIVNVEFDNMNAGDRKARYIASLNLRCMGVVNELKRRNPPHKARVHAALFAKYLGMSQSEFEHIWVEMGTDIGYVDLENAEYRAYQMASIFDNPMYHSFPTCTKLKADGCCVGDVCPRYKDLNHIGYEPRKIQRRWTKNGA